MERRALGLFALVLILAGCSSPQEQPPNEQITEPVPTSLANLYQTPEDLDRLVELAERVSYQIFCGEGGGSGWGISHTNFEGTAKYIVTNHHVIRECLEGQEIKVWDSEGSDFTATVVIAKDRDSDWKTEVTGQDLALLMPSIDRFETISDLSYQYSLGAWVMTAGYPDINDYYSFVITTGNISSDSKVDGYNTTAAVNLGSSGSLVMNARGQVIGTVYAGYDQATLNDNGLFLPLNRLDELFIELSK